MLKIKNDTEIYLTKGDSLCIDVTIQDAEGNAYTPKANDVIRFAMKKSIWDEEPLILKTLDNNALQINFSPAETKTLSVFNSPYIWDIELSNTSDDIVDTFLAGKLYITEEVH